MAERDAGVGLPKVGIVLLTYNHEICINRALDALLAQDYGNCEITVIDDCSTDDSYSIASRYRSHNIRVLQNRVNLGAAGNVQYAISLVSEDVDYILWASPDDVYAPTYISTLIEVMRGRNNIVAAQSSMAVIGASRSQSNEIRFVDPLSESRDDWVQLARVVIHGRDRARKPIVFNSFIHGLLRADVARMCLRGSPAYWVMERQCVLLMIMHGGLDTVDQVLLVKHEGMRYTERYPNDALTKLRYRPSSLIKSAGAFGHRVLTCQIPWQRKLMGLWLSLELLWFHISTEIIGRSLRRILPVRLFRYVRSLALRLNLY